MPWPTCPRAHLPVDSSGLNAISHERPRSAAALHVALLYLWQLDLLRLESLAAVADAAGLWVITPDMPASQVVPQVLP